MNKHAYCSAPLLALFVFAGSGQAAQLVGGASGSCVNLPEHGGSAPDGTMVRLFHCHDSSSNQVWTISNGQINSSFGSCLDVQGSAGNDGAQVIIVACNGRPSQKWSISNGQIVGIGGKCLDVLGGGTADTTPLIISTCSASPSQQWSVTSSRRFNPRSHWRSCRRGLSTNVKRFGLESALGMPSECLMTRDNGGSCSSLTTSAADLPAGAEVPFATNTLPTHLLQSSPPLFPTV